MKDVETKWFSECWLLPRYFEGTHYICSDCGMDEAFMDTQGDVMPPEEWFLNSFKQED